MSPRRRRPAEWARSWSATTSADRSGMPAGEVRHEAEMRLPKTGGAPKDISGVRLTHPERILWEGPGVTKQGLADFYTEIADWILPHLTNRVLSLLRCPSGVSQQCFFAK